MPNRITPIRGHFAAALCLLCLASCERHTPQPSIEIPSIRPALEVVTPKVVPVPIPEPVVDYQVTTAATPKLPQPNINTVFEPEAAESDSPASEQPVSTPENFSRFEFLGEPFEPGTFTKRTWFAGETFYGSAIPTPVLVATGIEAGPTLCLTAAVHGDELNGIETVRRVMHELDVNKLRGKVIGVPIVNLQGFQRHSRYLPDRRDLNRFFPGNTSGSSASRMAHSFFNEVIMHCDGLVDLHTGSFHRTNLPQLRANLQDPRVLTLTEGFGSTVILHSEGAEGTLRHAAVAAGIPAVTLEAGEPLRVDEAAVAHSVKGIFSLLDTLDLYDRRSLWGNPEPVYYTATWLRSDSGGILTSSVKLGRKIRAGDLLGTVTDPITNESVEVRSPHDGRVIGMAVNQFVMPGFALYHLGLKAPVEEATLEADTFEIDHSVASLEPNDED